MLMTLHKRFPIVSHVYACILHGASVLGAHKPCVSWQQLLNSKHASLISEDVKLEAVELGLPCF